MSQNDDSVDRSGIRLRGEGEPFVLLAAPLPLVPAGALAAAEAVAHALSSQVMFLRVSSQPLEFGAPKQADHSNEGRAEYGRAVIERSGDFLSVVGTSATALKPDLVVIPDVRDASGRAIHALALECGTPVLLARNFAGSGVIVAATDLRDPSLPVLRMATLVASSLRARVVFFHNLNPSLSAAGEGVDSSRGYRPSVLDRLDDLVSAAHALRTESENIVTTRQGTSEALLSVVQNQRPDIVVVGARHRASLQERAAALAVTTIDDVPTSVLVVPHDRSAARFQAQSAR